MKKIVFDFLATMELKEIDKPSASLKADLQPADNAHFRLFADGAIYPSEKFAQVEQLEYQSKNSSNPEYGYDVFLSSDWGQYTAQQPIACIAKVSKHLGKVDLFGRAKYEDDGKPKSSVLSQKNTSGLDLITMLETVFCEEGEKLFANGRLFVDLRIVQEAPVKTVANGIYLIPKKFVKGKNAGEITFERRENIQVYPLEIVNYIVHPETIVAREAVTPAPTAAQSVPAAVVTEVKQALNNHESSVADVGAALFGR